VKFQIHIAEAESSKEEPFRIDFSYQDRSRQEYWRRMSFSPSEWREVKEHCEKVGLEFLASPFSLAAVDLLEDLGVIRYKIGSGEVTNLLMLEKIGRTGKPVLLSSGMSSFSELDQAIEFLHPFGNELTILQCTTSYPTTAERLGLNVIQLLGERYPGFRIGYSDHSGRLETCLAARVLGAEVLEFHAVFDRRMFGPDSSSSLNIEEIAQLVKGIHFIEDALAHPVDKSDVTPYQHLKKIFQKSLAVNKDLPAGHQISFDDLESKKPSGLGIPAEDFREVLGKTLRNAKIKYEFLTSEDLYH
jgi:N-acetylneuraminate synthase